MRVAAGFLELRPAAEHTVELVDKQGDGFMAFILGHRRIHVGAVNFYVSFGGETMGYVLFGVALELDAEADDALFMTEETNRFLLHELLQ